MKRYTNFDDIDRDLKFLRLKSRIDMEEVKLSIRYGKETLSDTFSPINLIVGTIGSILQKAFVLKIVDKLVGGISRKLH